jgi:hypothetical protein
VCIIAIQRPGVILNFQIIKPIFKKKNAEARPKNRQWEGAKVGQSDDGLMIDACNLS